LAAVGHLSELLGHRLSEVRLQRGLTLDQVSERAGLSKSYVCDIEHGYKNPTLDVLERLAHAVRVPLCSLLAVS
jgi:XRE family transcriptional regulator of biofilm formation